MNRLKFVILLVLLTGCNFISFPSDFGMVGGVDLQSLPNVSAWNTSRTGESKLEPTTNIIHLLDWHLVTKDAFIADLKSQGVKTDYEKAYQQHLDDVTKVQVEHQAILLELINKHKVKEVYIEGLTEENKDTFALKLDTIKKAGEALAPIALRRDDLDSAGKAELDKLMAEHRLDLLRIGAAGELAMQGQITLLPLDVEPEYSAANPVDGDTVSISEAKQKAREAAIVSNLATKRGLVVIVMGGAHTLSFGEPNILYGTVKTETYNKLNPLVAD